MTTTGLDVCMRNQWSLGINRKGGEQELQSLQCQGQTVRSRLHLHLHQSHVCPGYNPRALWEHYVLMMWKITRYSLLMLCATYA